MVKIYIESKGNIGWPLREAFLGAFVSDNPGIRYSDLSRFGDVSRFEFWPPYLYGPDLFKADSSFVHPVLDARRFARSKLVQGGDEFFILNSALRRDLEQVTAAVYVPALRECFEQRKERQNLFTLNQYLALYRLQHLQFDVNIAIGCRASQSGLSTWSIGTLEEEAARAISGPLGGYPNFHTGPTANPWWGVDLGEIFEVSRVVIYNRTDIESLSELFCHFTILGSYNAQQWSVCFRKATNEKVGGIGSSPYTVNFPSSVPLRHLRIQNDTSDILHLVRIEIYGSRGSSSTH